MMNFRRLYAALILYIIPACSSTNGNLPELKVESEMNICFIYCDLTDSMNKTSHQKVIDNALKIFDSLGVSHDLYFFTVGNRSMGAAIWKSTCASYKMDKLMTQPQRNARLKVFSDARNALDKQLKFAEAQDSATRTCIIHTLKQGIQELLNINEQGVGNFTLIFLSDMLENCKGINLQAGKYKEAELALSKMVVEDSLSKFKNLKLAIVISAGKEYSDDEAIIKFWRNLFVKFGYQGPKIRPSANIPWAKIK